MPLDGEALGRALTGPLMSINLNQKRRPARPRNVMPSPLPDWTRIYRPDSIVDAKTASILFGYSRSAITKVVKAGKFPKPDILEAGTINGYKKQYWYWSTLLTENTRRRNLREMHCND